MQLERGPGEKGSTALWTLIVGVRQRTYALAELMLC